MIDSNITVGIPFTNETSVSNLEKSINSIVKANNTYYLYSSNSRWTN